MNTEQSDRPRGRRPQEHCLRCSFFIATASALFFATESAVSEPYAYISNYGDNTVSVIDVATDSVIDTITLTKSACRLALTPNGKKLYVTDCDSAVSVIDTTTNQPVAVIPVWRCPAGIVASPNGRYIYVASPCNEGRVSVISTETNTLVDEIFLGQGSTGIALNEDGTKMYVGYAEIPGRVSIMDIESLDIKKQLRVATWNSANMALTPDGQRMYLYGTGGELGAIDLSTDTPLVLPHIGLSHGLSDNDMSISPDGKHAYLTGTYFSGRKPRGYVQTIDTTTHTVINTTNVGQTASGVAPTPDGSRIYVNASWDHKVAVIDTTTNNIIHSISVGAYPQDIVILAPTMAPSHEFAKLVPKGDFFLGPEVADDSFWIRGFIRLSDSSNGIDPLVDTISVEVGDFSYRIPPRTLAWTGDGYKYYTRIGESKFDIALWPMGSPDKYWFKICLRKAKLGSSEAKLRLHMTIGDDTGSAKIKITGN